MMAEGAGRRQKLDKIRRFLLIIFLYLAFGIGALVVSLLMILPVVVLSGSQQHRVRRVRWINRLAFNIFIRSGMTLGAFNVSFINAERLNQPGQLIIANHPSLLDVVFLLGCIPNANCVVKRKILKNPFLAIPVYFANYIINDDAEGLLQDCVDSLEQGDPVIIFPEGTRTAKGQNHTFKRGAAIIMLTSNCPVRPVYISCEYSTLGKNDLWYVIPEQKITYCFTVLAELDVTSLIQTDKIKLPLKSRWLTKWLAEYYAKMDLDGPQRPSEKLRFPGTPENSAG